MKPGGNCTATLVVFALVSSFGTRMAIVGNDPAGSVFGCRLTWACAMGVRTSAPTRTSQPATCFRIRGNTFLA